jgi:Protein of unknown function (DUF2857)
LNAAQRHPLATTVALALDDPQTRMFLLTRLVDKIESGDAARQLLGAGMDQQVIDQLRGMTLTDALRFTAGHCGLALSIDATEIHGQLARVERAKRLRERLEYFIHNGASPRLLMHVFKIGPSDARRMRKQIAPQVAAGGRPKEPTEEERQAITLAWNTLKDRSIDEADRFWELHQQFKSLWISTLELVVMPSALKLL